MFTGIIKHLGVLRRQNPKQLTIFCKTLPPGLRKAESIAVNGVCLTITKINQASGFTVDIMPETRRKTALSDLKTGDIVNLELPVTPKDYLSGHILYGHIDGTGIIEKIKKERESRIFTVSTPPALTAYIVEKGAVAINGISLTIIAVLGRQFRVGIIPYTLKNTMLKDAKVKDKVNIETDILAKYLERIFKK